MTNEHTPGPWQVATFPTMATPIVCAGTLTIAGLVAMPVPGGHAINGEVWANARLIAAAPETAAERDRLKEINAELLAALVRISLDIDRQRRAGMNLSLLCLCTESLANAAIAKATGQAMQDMANSKKEIG